jgi:hypothetical protein
VRRTVSLAPIPSEWTATRSERETSYKFWTALDDLSGIYDNSPRFSRIPNWRIGMDFAQ